MAGWLFGRNKAILTETQEVPGKKTWRRPDDENIIPENWMPPKDPELISEPEEEPRPEPEKKDD